MRVPEVEGKLGGRRRLGTLVPEIDGGRGL